MITIIMWELLLKDNTTLKFPSYQMISFTKKTPQWNHLLNLNTMEISALITNRKFMPMYWQLWFLQLAKLWLLPQSKLHYCQNAREKLTLLNFLHNQFFQCFTTESSLAVAQKCLQLHKDFVPSYTKHWQQLTQRPFLFSMKPLYSTRLSSQLNCPQLNFHRMTNGSA